MQLLVWNVFAKTQHIFEEAFIDFDILIYGYVFIETINLKKINLKFYPLGCFYCCLYIYFFAEIKSIKKLCVSIVLCKFARKIIFKNRRIFLLT